MKNHYNVNKACQHKVLIANSRIKKANKSSFTHSLRGKTEKFPIAHEGGSSCQQKSVNMYNMYASLIVLLKLILLINKHNLKNWRQKGKHKFTLN